ncbi:hypothetical protein [Anabaena azotica]|uniref:hypothetical protein n=1 Tax=Anabaena azotica TaxID=197653 RepID=UPI0039A57C14
MPINFDVSEMRSIAVRQQVTAQYGERTVTSLEGYDSTGKDSQGNNLFEKAWNLGKKVVGMIGDTLSKILPNFSISGCWAWLVQTANFIYNFNWNAGDDELRKSIESQKLVLAGMAGSLVGNALGYAACGFVPGAITYVFNEALGAKVLKNVGEEFLEEFTQNLHQLIGSIFRLGTQILLTELFINVRKIIKSKSDAIAKFFGNERLKQMIDAWGKEGSKPWSFSKAVNDKIESIDNKYVEAFTEEAVEEFSDACQEAGYIAAATFDAKIAEEAYKQQNMPVLGKMKYLEVKPNRKNDDEVIVMAGNTELLKNNLVGALNTRQIISMYDVGAITEVPTEMRFRRFKPHVYLKFTELTKDRPKDETRSLIKMQISFRLMNETSSIALEKLKTLSEKIIAKFSGETPYKISKGARRFSYADHERGYQFNLQVISELEARRVVDDVLGLQGHTPDWDLLIPLGNQNASTPKPKEKELVLGEKVEQEVQGIPGIVTFTKSYCVLDKRPKKPVYLADVKGQKRLLK